MSAPKPPKPKPKNLSLDAFLAKNSATTGHSCSFKMLLESIAPEDVAKIREALANKGVQTSAIRKVLKETYGWTRGDQVIGRHRRGQCEMCK